ncbi:hypothetical protein Syun_026919 [Stephania yunnanensis]|uniref:Uncharacterized protein n=1 Tax=Stephania yunnanensis TaxID=152371 RepID=A0AAP0HKK2_9MAGN
MVLGRDRVPRTGVHVNCFLSTSQTSQARLDTNNNNNNNNNNNSSSSWSLLHDREAQADVLPEVLRHSLPSKIFEAPSDSTLSVSSKWVLPQNPERASSVSADALNPLRAYLSLPQVTFGPRRSDMLNFFIDFVMLVCEFGNTRHRDDGVVKLGEVEVPRVNHFRYLGGSCPESKHSVLASTANDLRQDRYTPINNSKKVEAAAEALSQIGKAFFIATTIVFGGAALTFAWTVSKLDMNNIDDMKTKVHDLAQPKFETIKEQLVPLRTWTKNTAKKWHIEREEKMENPLIKELSKQLGAKTSD